MKMPTDNSTFTFFNRLPIEIRLKIWEAALPGPRLINIIEKRLKAKDHSTLNPPSPSSSYPGTLALWSASKAPSTLFVCRESHQITSKFLVPSFAFPGSIPEIHFDFGVDTLYLRFDNFLFLDANELDDDGWYFVREIQSIDHNVGKVRNLALFLDPKQTGLRVYSLGRILRWFGNIQNLTIVVGHFDREEDGGEDILFIEPIDVFKTCRNYEAIPPTPPQLHGVMETPLAVDLVPEDELERRLEKERRMKHRIKRKIMVQGIEARDPGDIPMPHIEYKSVVTGGLKHHLDRLRREHQQRIDEMHNAKVADGDNNTEVE